MAAVFTNKFTVELTAHTARIIFIDERPKLADGIPPSQATVAEVVMLISDVDLLSDLINKLRNRK